ncbi:MAG: hypothetical protein GWN67_08805 [Phycisphaerae bacterium]|nr:hypothetical protein [Phycisphaerae bacterium]NIR64182.1 hypothetical protein [candidate division Zixibacteria bacterium]NIP52186.1 hypothetical protein [Phycisphaerae bacterium]NIS51193.1 hypothetical protein [Phycisphaerae bacterium]NIU08863.1 hypothetical protein [Phycisphaerae bacterium]
MYTSPAHINLSSDFDSHFSVTLEGGIWLDNGDWQTDYPPPPPMADMLEDGYRRDKFGDTITLTFSNLKAGTYKIWTYHVDMSYPDEVKSTFAVRVNGDVVINNGETLGRVGGDLGFCWFYFTSNGSDDVVIEFDGTAVYPQEDEEVWLNGFFLKGLRSLGGGGIAGNGCLAQISNCIITENWSSSGGGLANCDGLVSDNIIHNNSASVIMPPGYVGAYGAGGGLSYCDGTIQYNTISDNWGWMGGGLHCCGGIIRYNIIFNNESGYPFGVVNYCDGLIHNNTISNNNGYCGLSRCSGTITNCVVWENLYYQIGDGVSTVNYSNVQGGWPGICNIDEEPLFTDPNNGDYHLKSKAGRWDPNSKTWVQDDVTSPCIDAGDPMTPIGPEPLPNGGRINMGAYGGTVQASKSPRKAADFTDDMIVNYKDLKIFTDYWLETGEFVPCDLNGSKFVNFIDFTFFAEDWLKYYCLLTGHNLSPADGAVTVGEEAGGNIYTTLVYSPVPTAVKHTGYFSNDYSKVYNRAQDVNLGQPPYPQYYEATFFVGHPSIPPAIESLVRGTRYYWAVDATLTHGNTCPGEIWEFTIQGYKAYKPNPPNEATFISTTPFLSWLPGYGADDHEIYMSTSWEDVNNAVFDAYDPHPEFVASRQDPNYQVVTALPHSTKIYWRVDQAKGRVPPFFIASELYKGDVWEFTTLP